MSPRVKKQSVFLLYPRQIKEFNEITDTEGEESVEVMLSISNEIIICPSDDHSQLIGLSGGCFCNSKTLPPMVQKSSLHRRWILFYVFSMHRFPKGLEDVSKYPNLIQELLQRGWMENDLADVLRRNFMRVFEEVERVSAVTTVFSSRIRLRCVVTRVW